MDEAKLKKLHDMAVERGDKETALRALKDIKALRAETPKEEKTGLAAYSDKLMSLLEKLDTSRDVAGSVITSLVAEPVAGLAGIGDNFRINPINSYEDLRGPKIRLTTPDERAATVETVRDQITVPPSTPGGKEVMAGAAEFLEPVVQGVNQATTEMGDMGYDFTGSPRVAAGLATVPQGIMEVGTLGLATKPAKIATKAKRIPIERKISKELESAAPTQEALRASSDELFHEIDDMGVTVDRDAFAGLVDRSEQAMRSKGGSPRVTTEAWGALEDMRETLNRLDSGETIPLSELEELREIASVAADNLAQPKKQAVGLAIVNEIDDFIENATPQQFNMPQGVNPNEVGVKYKKAREQWGRYRRSQMLDKAVEKAANQASGFENGIRIKFREILNSDKKSKFFSKEELAAMRAVEQGTAGANLYKALGKAGIDGFGVGKGNNALMAFGTFGGVLAYTGGDWVTAFAIVGASSVAKKLAERMTLNNAKMANQVIRAGTDARKITEAYIRNTPKGLRNADELSLLLLNKNISLDGLKGVKIMEEAAELARTRRLQLVSATSTGQANSKPEQQPSPAQLRLVNE